jgi:hypothetical protein
LTFDEYGANTQKLAAKSVSIAIYFAKTFQKSEVLAAACTIFITEIASGDSNVGLGLAHRPKLRGKSTLRHTQALTDVL